MINDISWAEIPLPDDILHLKMQLARSDRGYWGHGCPAFQLAYEL